MTLVTLPYRPQPGELEDISQLMADFDAILSVVNGGITNDNLAPGASIGSEKVPGALPVGGITLFSGDVAPSGWLLCDGAAVSRSTYAGLFAVVGTKYGVGDNSTTFNLPNLASRIAVGRNAADGDFAALGQAGGAKTVVLDGNTLPFHTHGLSDPGHAHAVSQGVHSHNAQGGKFAVRDNAAEGFWGALLKGQQQDYSDIWYSGAVAPNYADVSVNPAFTGMAVQAAGGSVPHQNLQPYLVLNHIIRT